MEVTDETMNTEQQQPEAQIQWTAHEYVSHDKPSSWYVGFIVITLLMSIAVYFLSGQGFSGLLSSLVIVIMSIALFIYAKRPPRDLTYILGSTSFSIGDKEYRYQDFRSFSFVNTDGIVHIRLDPLHRFGMSVTFYYDPNDHEAILQFLSNRLPNVEREPDLIDRLTQRLRL